MKKRIALLLGLALLLCAAAAGAQELHITLGGVLDLTMEKMGVDLAAFKAPEVISVEPVWDERGVLQLKDNGYSLVNCLGCDLQFKDGLWCFPENVAVRADHFSDGYGVTVYFGEDQEWYYEDGELMYSRIPTTDGGRVTYAPINDIIQIAFVKGSQIITGEFTLDGDLDGYYVESFTDDTIATVRYTADKELEEFYVTDRASGTKYAYGGSQGWFVRGESGYEPCEAPEDFEDYTIEDIMDEYPPLKYGPEAKLGGNRFSISGSTIGSAECSPGDVLKFASGSCVKELTFWFDADTAPLVTDACVILTDRSFVELLVLDGEAGLFNPEWISFDETSGVRTVQLLSGETMEYESFLETLK